MRVSILKHLNNYSYDTKDINRLLVSSFLIVNNIKTVKNEFINDFIITEDEEELEELTYFVELFKGTTFDIEKLIELFEFVVSPKDKEINGAVYTPEFIRKHIVDSTIKKLKTKNLSSLKFGDIACGCGGFFKTILEIFKKKTNKSYFEIFRDNIYGLDIQEYSIIRTKILLCLIAITDNEDLEHFSFNLFCGNALDFDWNEIPSIKQNNGFDIIVGNPPYVSSSKMDKETKSLLKKWTVSSTGKPDLYIPFFEIGMQFIKNDGVLGYITVNSFFRSLNGRSVRAYFSKNKYELSIIDFGGEQLFKKRSTYTCICLITKNEKNIVNYIKALSNTINEIKKKDYTRISYENLDNHKGWYLISEEDRNIINRIEESKIVLGEKYEIRNGFATLKNNIYVFRPTRENANYYYLLKDNIEYKIEKSICRNAIKPNTLKSEAELNDKIEKLIFPYSKLIKNGSSDIKIINDKDLKTKFPNTYKYLLSQKKVLASRDKGERKYEEWFAYGRTQALKLTGKKLLFPYMSDKPYFVLSEDEDLMFYNGYAIFSESTEDLLFLKKILTSKVFWFYIKKTSKPYEGNYFSMAKNYIKNFGICDFNDEDKKKLLKLTNNNDIDIFLERKYNFKINNNSK